MNFKIGFLLTYKSEKLSTVIIKVLNVFIHLTFLIEIYYKPSLI